MANEAGRLLRPVEAVATCFGHDTRRCPSSLTTCCPPCWPCWCRWERRFGLEGGHIMKYDRNLRCFSAVGTSHARIFLKLIFFCICLCFLEKISRGHFFHFSFKNLEPRALNAKIHETSNLYFASPQWISAGHVETFWPCHLLCSKIMHCEYMIVRKVC